MTLSNYKFKFVYIIINDKLADKFFSKYEEAVKRLGVITANIIFCDQQPKLKKDYMNNPFLNPGKVVTNFSKVVEYLNTDECGFNNILNSNICTIDSSFTGASFGFTFKEVSKKL